MGEGDVGGDGGVACGFVSKGESERAPVRSSFSLGALVCRSLYCPIKARVTNIEARTIDREIARDRWGEGLNI